MEKLKSSITNMVLVLTGVAVVTGAILAYINHVTEEPIKVQKEKTLADGIKSVMGGGDLKVSKTDTVRQNDAKGKELTYIIEGNILGYTLLEHAETPGLGAKADKWFQKGEKGDIIGKNPKEKLTVSKDGGKVDAITASTITSRAFLLAVNNAYSAYKATPVDANTGATKQNADNNKELKK